MHAMRSLTRLLATLLLLAWAVAAHAEPDPPVPAPLDSVVNDYAGLLTGAEFEELQAIGDDLYAETAAPLVVVIVPSVTAFPELTAETIEAFSEEWMSYWELADETGRGEDILIFLTVKERYLRVRLGTGYPETAQSPLQTILVETMVPALKEDAWADALIDGATALAALAREYFPQPPEGWVEPVEELGIAMP